MLKSTPNVRKSPRSGLNLEGRLSDPQVCFRGDDIGSPPSPVPQPSDATRLHLSHDCAGLVDEAGGNRSTKTGQRGPSRRLRTTSGDTHARLMRSAKSSGCLISGDTMQPSELVDNDNKGSVGMGVCGYGATADYLTTPGQLTPAGLLAEEMARGPGPKI